MSKYTSSRRHAGYDDSRERYDAQREDRDIDDIDAIDARNHFPRNIFRDVPEFPVHALPGAVRGIVEEGAKAIGCAPDLIALPALAAVGAAIGNARVIKPKRSWTESANLFGAVVADSGEKKTVAVSVAIEPTRREQRRLNREYEEALEEHAREMRVWKRDCQDAKKAGKTEPPPPPAPIRGKVHVNDAIVEALIPILRDNPRGLLQHRDEIAGWIASFNQYRQGKGGDRGFWLQAWSVEPADADRKGEAGQRPLAAPLPLMSVVGSIQPDLLPELAGDREDGMLERFLVSWPKPRSGRFTRDEISERTENRYRDLFARLRELHLDRDDHSDPLPIPVSFAPDALECWIDAYDQHREEMDAPWLQPGLRSAWSKLEAYLLRLTLIIACCRFVTPQEDGKKPPERVETGDVLRAIRLVDYFKAHARAVHAALRPEDRKLLLLEDVTRFLRQHGGSWEGEPAELHEALESSAKPAKPDGLTRKLNEFSRQDLGIQVVDAPRFDPEKKQGRRGIRITLGSGVDGVDGRER